MFFFDRDSDVDYIHMLFVPELCNEISHVHGHFINLS